MVDLVWHIAFGLPRLSEDLDFVDIGKNIDNDKFIKRFEKIFY